jgi:hypothetical protein
VPVAVVAGTIAADAPRPDGVALADLVTAVGRERAMSAPARALTAVAGALADGFPLSEQSSPPM